MSPILHFPSNTENYIGLLYKQHLHIYSIIIIWGMFETLIVMVICYSILLLWWNKYLHTLWGVCVWEVKEIKLNWLRSRTKNPHKSRKNKMKYKNLSFFALMYNKKIFSTPTPAPLLAKTNDFHNDFLVDKAHPRYIANNKITMESSTPFHLVSDVMEKVNEWVIHALVNLPRCLSYMCKYDMMEKIHKKEKKINSFVYRKFSNITSNLYLFISSTLAIIVLILCKQIERPQLYLHTTDTVQIAEWENV